MVDFWLCCTKIPGDGFTLGIRDEVCWRSAGQDRMVETSPM